MNKNEKEENKQMIFLNH